MKKVELKFLIYFYIYDYVQSTLPIYLYLFYILSHAPLKKEVSAKMDLLWKFLKPISFALIGKEVNFEKLDGTTVAYGIVIIIVGSVVSFFFPTFKFEISCITIWRNYKFIMKCSDLIK